MSGATWSINANVDYEMRKLFTRALAMFNYIFCCLLLIYFIIIVTHTHKDRDVCAVFSFIVRQPAASRREK